jgi:hypothetical protein
MDELHNLRCKIKMYEYKINWLYERIFELENQLSDKIINDTEQKNLETKTKKDEVLQALEYLKGKENKTKQDNISIYSLEMILKNLG